MTNIQKSMCAVITCMSVIWIGSVAGTVVTCPSGCCSGGGLNGTACLPTGANCSCQYDCDVNADCCHNFYEVCAGEVCPPFPFWLNIETNNTLSANNTISMGDTLDYSCKAGYAYKESDVSGTQHTLCIGPDGSWDGDIQQCSESETEDESSPIEGEYYHLIAAIMGGAIAFEFVVFCFMDVPVFYSGSRRCTKIANEIRSRRQEAKALKHQGTNSVTPLPEHTDNASANLLQVHRPNKAVDQREVSFSNASIDNIEMTGSNHKIISPSKKMSKSPMTD